MQSCFDALIHFDTLTCDRLLYLFIDTLVY